MTMNVSRFYYHHLLRIPTYGPYGSYDVVIICILAFCFVFNKLNSYLFEANVFTSFTRMESIDRAKRG